jgi:hypothetical protein
MVPLTRKSTLETDEADVAFTVVEIVTVGVAAALIGLPVIGDVIEIVGVAWATVAATSAQTAANARRREKAGGAEIALGTTRSTSEQ